MSDYKKAFTIEVTSPIVRKYIVVAKDKKQALDIYYQFDDRTQFISEKIVDECESKIEVI